MAEKIVAGNWKINLNSTEAFALGNSLNIRVKDTGARVIIFPPALYILALSRMNQGEMAIGIQNFHPASHGAFTGEISLDQARSAGASVALIGHSERREWFGESNAFLKEKVDAALREDFDFIFCCGEPLEVREAGEQAAYVERQLEESLFHLTADEMRKAVIAYEPIWAIGTGKTASSEQAEQMHADIRLWIAKRYSVEVALIVPILYGGSCKPDNAEELFACPNIDGGLIGGASLNADDFCAILDAI